MKMLRQRQRLSRAILGSSTPTRVAWQDGCSDQAAVRAIIRGPRPRYLGMMLLLVALRSAFAGTLFNPEPRYTRSAIPWRCCWGAWISGWKESAHTFENDARPGLVVIRGVAVEKVDSNRDAGCPGSFPDTLVFLLFGSVISSRLVSLVAGQQGIASIVLDFALLQPGKTVRVRT